MCNWNNPKIILPEEAAPVLLWDAEYKDFCMAVYYDGCWHFNDAAPVYVDKTDDFWWTYVTPPQVGT